MHLLVPNRRPRFCCNGCFSTNMLSSYGGFQGIAMYHHRNNLIKLTHYDETKKRAHDSQIVRAEDNLNTFSIVYHFQMQRHFHKIVQILADILQRTKCIHNSIVRIDFLRQISVRT